MLRATLLLALLLTNALSLPAQQILRGLDILDYRGHYVPMGDRNGDGYEDVLVASQIYVGPGWANYDYEFRLYSGRDGTLLRTGPRWAYPDYAECYPHGDHDGDGVPDYICFDTDYANAVGRVSVRSGRDDHVFWMVQRPANVSWFYHVAGGMDINGDGHLDVVVSNPVGNSYQGEIWAYDHTGALLYHKIGTGMINSLAQSLARLGDINGDGCDDYIAGLGDPNWYGAVAVISGPTGQILRVVTGQNFGDYIGSGCTGCGDLDGDGLPDFAAGGGLSGSYGSVQAFSSRTGQRLWATYSGYVGDRFGFILRASDYDQDGIDDILSAAWNGVRAVSGRDGSILAYYIPNSTASLGTFEAQPLRTPEGFPRLVVRTQVLGAFLMSAAPHASTPLGQGCAIGTATAPPRLGMRELGGSSRRLTVSGAEHGTAAFLLLGLADASTGPLPLAALGLPQCVLHPNIAAIGCLVTGGNGAGGGYAAHDVAVPSASAFGLGIDAQWLTVDQAGRPAGLSNAIRFAITPTW